MNKGVVTRRLSSYRRNRAKQTNRQKTICVCKVPWPGWGQPGHWPRSKPQCCQRECGQKVRDTENYEIYLL